MVAARLTDLVDEIRERNLSRNRNFTLMSRPRYRAAMRLKRYLDGLAAEIRQRARSRTLDLEIHHPAPDRVLLMMRDRAIQARRGCYLSTAELACLRRHHPDVAKMLDASYPGVSGAGGSSSNQAHGDA